MRTDGTEFVHLVEAGSQQIVGALRRAAAEGLDVEGLTDVLKVAFSCRNQVDAAVTSAIGALDQAAEKAPDGEVTMALSCATWLSHNLQISSSAAHAQVHLARRLPSLPATAAAFQRGELSPQHASVIVRGVEAVEHGGGEAGPAEALLLQEARQRDPRDLLRWGLSLLHRLAPQEMVAEEEGRHRRRYLRLSEAFDGGYELEGYLDPEGGATLKTALNGLLGPRPRQDRRSPGQRRADGLVESPPGSWTEASCRCAAASVPTSPSPPAWRPCAATPGRLPRCSTGAFRSPVRPCAGSLGTPRSHRSCSAPEGIRCTWAGSTGRPRPR
ncbi:MAG: 13E12 repeat family protein [Candidatus Dormibacteraeota bacterium]|nr:13E12 repeat family protein [Candidatus Dormibacteraeota bacterium]